MALMSAELWLWLQGGHLLCSAGSQMGWEGRRTMQGLHIAREPLREAAAAAAAPIPAQAGCCGAGGQSGQPESISPHPGKSFLPALTFPSTVWRLVA